jgi:hypothetical protein
MRALLSIVLFLAFLPMLLPLIGAVAVLSGIVADGIADDCEYLN